MFLAVDEFTFLWSLNLLTNINSNLENGCYSSFLFVQFNRNSFARNNLWRNGLIYLFRFSVNIYNVAMTVGRSGLYVPFNTVLRNFAKSTGATE